MQGDERRCPKCRARLLDCGFVGPARQYFRAVWAGFEPGTIAAMPGRAHCILCDTELPWTVEELTGRAA
jgi:hypothetical protein